MKKIVPFKKEFLFQTNLAEITSISLEHTLHIQDEQNIAGDLTVSGDYKMADSSTNTEPFSFEIPCDITVDEQYTLKRAIVDIEDFYYEVINNNTLSVNIEVKIDRLEDCPIERPSTLDTRIEKEKVQMEERELEDLKPIRTQLPVEDAVFPFHQVDNTTAVVEPLEPRIDGTQVKSLFDQMDESTETYATYKVCIVREEDSVETILGRYHISREELEQYNSLTEIKIGDKLIIPAIMHAKS